MALPQPPQPTLAQPPPYQAQARYQEHVRLCRHCRGGHPCPVGRHYGRKAGM